MPSSQQVLPAFDHQLPALTTEELETIACETAAVLRELLASDTLAAATARSYASALRYWDAWHRAATGTRLPLLDSPRGAVSVETACAFVAHHTPRLDGGVVVLSMPEHVRKRLAELEAVGARRVAKRSPGRVASDVPTLATIRHRIAALSACHRLANLVPPFVDAPAVQQAFRAFRNRVSNLAPAMLRQPKQPVRRDMLNAVLNHCRSDGLRGIRDAAMLHVAFHGGGRRRSELAAMRWPDLAPLALPSPVQGLTDGYLWQIYKAKGRHRERADQGVLRIPLLGVAAQAIDRWRDALLAHGFPANGPVWYRMVSAQDLASDWRPSTPITGADVWAMIKYRAKEAGFNSSEFGAHSLRSGATTTLLEEGGALSDATDMLDHSSIETTRTFYDHRDMPLAAITRLTEKGSR